MKILGIDPELRTIDFGIIYKQENKLSYFASGVIKTPDADFPQRLKVILASVSEVILTYTSDCSAIKKVFVNVNPQSTLFLGQAAPRSDLCTGQVLTFPWPSTLRAD